MPKSPGGKIFYPFSSVFVFAPFPIVIQHVPKYPVDPPCLLENKSEGCAAVGNDSPDKIVTR